MPLVFRKLLILLLTLSMLGGCITTQMHTTNTYITSEEVNGFLISSDKHQLVAITDQYHYIFELNAKQQTILSWSKRTLFKPTNPQVTVDAKQHVTGSFDLRIDTSKLSTEDQIFLQQNGFANHANYLDFSLHGIRYASGNVKLPQASELKPHLTMKVHEPDGTTGKLAKAVLTPVTLAADGATIVVGTVLAVPLLVYLAANPEALMH